MFLTILLQRLRLFLYVVDPFVKWVLLPHLGQPVLFISILTKLLLCVAQASPDATLTELQGIFHHVRLLIAGGELT